LNKLNGLALDLVKSRALDAISGMSMNDALGDQTLPTKHFSPKLLFFNLLLN